MILSPFRILAGLTLAATAASAYKLTDAKLSVTTLDGANVRLSEAFSESSQIKLSSVTLASDEVLRVTFAVQDDEGEAITPQQASVLLTDTNRKSIAFPTTLKKGKAIWTLRPDRVPTLGRSISLKLLVASPDSSSKPLSLPLLNELNLPGRISTAQTPRQKASQDGGFLPHPARFHTFGTPAKDKMPKKIVSVAAAAGVVALPWTVLLILLSQVLPSLSFRSPATSTLALLASLAFLELLAVRYWWGDGFTLFKLLPWTAVGGVASLIAGREALGELKRARVGKQ